MKGATVLELGTGPILANAVRFIANGAATYTGVDRFDLIRRDAVVRRAYRELIENLSASERERCEGLIAPDGAAEIFDDRIRFVVAQSEEIAGRLPPKSYDLIVSFDVLEHVDDLCATLRNLRELLKPEGLMVHRVDVSAHNVGPEIHPLAELVFSEQLWKAISSGRAIYNRLRPSEFINTAELLGFETMRFERTKMLSNKDIDAVRHKLWGRFSGCSYEDLATLDFRWCARLLS